MEQIIANGLYLGAQYALIALGLTLIFSLMNVLNFAHGQMYVFGGFITYTVVAQFGLPFVVGLIASAVMLAVMGAADREIPVPDRSSGARQRDESTMLLAAGIAFFFDAVILLVFGEKQRGVPKIVNGVFNWDMRIIMPYDRILIGLLAVVLIVGFILFMQYSRTGRAMRALAQDRTAAQLMGVDVDRYSMIGFALGAMLAGLVGGASGHDHRRQSRHGRADLGQGLHDDHDRRRRGDLGRHRRRLHPGDAGKRRTDASCRPMATSPTCVIFVSLMIFLAIRPQGLMGKPWG